MRCAHAAALLLTGSSAVLSSSLPHRNRQLPFLVQVGEIATKCPQPLSELLPDITEYIEKAVEEGKTSFQINVTKIIDACDVLGSALKGDLTPDRNGPSNFSVPPDLDQKPFWAYINDITTKCPQPVLELMPDIIKNLEAADKVKNDPTFFWIELAKISVACETFGPIHKRDLTPDQNDLSNSSVLPGLDQKPLWAHINDIATKCPRPVLEKLPDIFSKLEAAHKAKNDTTPAWLDVSLVVHTCELLFQPNLVADQSGPSNSSTQVSRLFARQSPELDLGKRYSPTDPNFLAAVAKALYDRRWAFYFDDQGFWTSHVTEAITHHKYNKILTMEQEKKVEDKVKGEKAAAHKAKKEEKKKLKAEKKAAKKAEKEALKQMTHEERKKYKAEKKALKKAEKSERKRIKQQEKADKKAAKAILAKTLEDKHLHDKKAAWHEEVRIAEEKRKFFAGGGGPAIGEDNLEWI